MADELDEQNTNDKIEGLSAKFSQEDWCGIERNSIILR